MKEEIRTKTLLARIFIEHFFNNSKNIVNKLMLEGRVTKKYSVVLKLYRFMLLEMEKYLKYFK